MFVAIDGIDGSGKSSVARAIGLLLRESGYDIHLTEEPTKSIVGNAIRNFLKLDYELNIFTGRAITHLFVADRYYHQLEIRENLNAGKIVITDRYYYSTFAYQTLYPGISIDLLKNLHKDVIRPNIAIILDVDPEVAIKRIDSRNSKSSYEKLEFLKKVRSNYLKLKDILVDDNIIYVSNNGRLLETIQEIIYILKKYLKLNIKLDNSKLKDIVKYVT